MNEPTYLYKDKEVKIIHEYVHNEQEYVVVTDGYDNIVLLKSYILKHPFSESRWERRKLQLEKRIEYLENNKKKVEDLIKKSAVETLTSRMKLNTVFGNHKEGLTVWALAITGELEKLIKDINVDKEVKEG